MLTKLIDASSYHKETEPSVSILDIDLSQNGLIKKAEDAAVTSFVSQLKPEKNKTYIHILAMSAGEYWSSNRNSDNFPQQNLIDCHHTFVTSPAHIFRNHINKNPEIAIGKIIFSMYNPRMKRVELIGELWNEKAQDVIDDINSGKWPRTSMACKTPFDVCSICHNKARTRDEYCEHLSYELGRIYPDGRKVQAMNIAPLKFFDLSIISGRQADPASSVLQKVASVDAIIGSVDAALQEGLEDLPMQKAATLKKLSELVKEIDGDILGIDSNLDNLVSRVSDPHESLINVLRNYKLNEIFSTLGHLGISPSISFLAELIARKFLGENGVGIGPIASAYIDKEGTAGMLDFDRDFGEVTEPNLGVANVLFPYLADSSYLPEHVENRISLKKQASTFGYMPGTNVGYAGNGPHIEPTIYEKFRSQNLEPEQNSKKGLLNVLNTILAIGGAALAAKWYITQVIESKMKEQELSHAQDGVKIVLVKSASDYKLTYKLAKTAMLKLIQKKKVD